MPSKFNRNHTFYEAVAATRSSARLAQTLTIQPQQEAVELLNARPSLPQLGPAGASHNGSEGANDGKERPRDNSDNDLDFRADLQRGTRRRVRPSDGLQVTRFHVWQSLSSPTADNLAPLHASVALAMSSDWHRGLNMREGTIRIERLPGKEVIEGIIILHHAHHSFDQTRSDAANVLQFVLSPPLLYSRLEANERVRGIIKIKFWNRKVTIKLPETQVLFIR